jgi:hypothetical protein
LNIADSRPFPGQLSVFASIRAKIGIMLGKEIFLQPRKTKENPLFGVSWFYPNTYAVGMFGLGYQLVWALLESDPELVVHRGFTDQQDSACQSSELFGFTVAWELDFINVFQVLEKNGVER